MYHSCYLLWPPVIFIQVWEPNMSDSRHLRETINEQSDLKLSQRKIVIRTEYGVCV